MANPYQRLKKTAKKFAREVNTLSIQGDKAASLEELRITIVTANQLGYLVEVIAPLGGGVMARYCKPRPYVPWELR